MAYNVNLETLGGEYVRTATLTKWHKKEGDKVNKGEILVTVETAKITVDIPSPETGIVIKILYEVGEDVGINETIAIIGESAENDRVQLEQKKPEKIEPQEQTISGHRDKNSERIFISPIARIIAKENNISLDGIKGTGANSRIVKEDVLKIIEEKKFASTDINEKSNDELVKTIKMSGRRKGIAQKMSSSSATIPHVTIMADAKVEVLREIRATMNQNSKNTKLSLTDFIMYLTVKALKNHPMMNSHYEDGEIKVFSNVNLGIAVDLEEGLLVPVIKNCNEKTIFEISIELRQLAEKAKQGKISPNEVTEGTFTISNLGMYGIKYFTPIINQPEVAILGIGKIEADGRNLLPLSLSFDHQVIDGAPAARFLNNLKEILENPYLVLFD